MGQIILRRTNGFSTSLTSSVNTSSELREGPQVALRPSLPPMQHATAAAACPSAAAAVSAAVATAISISAAAAVSEAAAVFAAAAEVS